MSTIEPTREATAPPFPGEILDADGHMYLFPEMADKLFDGLPSGSANDFLRQHLRDPGHQADRERNRRDLWIVKGMGALGAYDPRERLEALDMMGVRAQLVFPNNPAGEDVIDSDIARAGCQRYNDYALEFQKSTNGRARVVMGINQTRPEWAMQELDRVIRKGAKAIGLQASVPPGGVSPAHEIWDPLWARLQEANVVATLHLGAGGLLSSVKSEPMFPDRGWANATALKGAPANRPGGEEAISPYFMLVAHLPAEVYLQTMVMGSVFERFPRLRLGIIELSAGWLGPCVERMNLWVEFMAKVGRTYPLKPSEYVARNVRVTPFWHENLPKIIERHGLEDVYVYSSDYPHLEGSRDPIGKFRKHLERLPAAYAKKFFVENGKWLFPDA